MNEIYKLDQISRNSSYSDGVMATAIAHCFKVLARHCNGPSILELGPAEGLMTSLLVRTGHEITLVEGSETFCDILKRRFPSVTVVHSLFETFRPNGRFDTIILGHVLEHVIDPVGLLKQVKSWLSPSGRIFCAVPNANSVHRQAAVIMELLATPHSLNASDIEHGHRRVFYPEQLKSAFVEAGLIIELFGGYWLKPLSNRQIEGQWTQEMIEAFMELGERYPEIAGEIYIVAS
jgi:2-polyprenyl-3-methyl-5-hydroxy-6-metoxy-1,4-benzoquinol methylase